MKRLNITFLLCAAAFFAMTAVIAKGNVTIVVNPGPFSSIKKAAKAEEAVDFWDGDLSDDICFADQAIESPVFSPTTPPVTGSSSGRRVPKWVGKNGSAGPIPPGPVEIEGPTEGLRLIPYGCTNLRIAEFPVVDRREEE